MGFRCRPALFFWQRHSQVKSVNFKRRGCDSSQRSGPQSWVDCDAPCQLERALVPGV